MHIRPFAEADTEAVVALWKRCDLTRPWNDPRRDIARKLGVGAHLFLVGELDGEIVASAMAGYEGHRGWINYLGVDPDYRRRGLARQMMEAVVALLEREGCPKINLQVRDSNTAAIAFYEALGFVHDPVVSLGRRLVDDD